MGKEAQATVRVGASTAPARVLLESGELIIRGALARRVPHSAMKNVAASRGELRFTLDGEPVVIDLGAGTAEAWLEAIQNPRSRSAKLGVKPGMKVAALGKADEEALAEIEAASGAPVSRRLGSALDLVLLFAPEPEGLARLASIAPRLAPKGAAWVLWPKGRKDFSHDDVVSAAKAAGLVQTKSMGFSATLTGLRLTRPASK